MPQATPYTFTAKPAQRASNAHPDSPRDPEPYLADDALIRAVNLAIFLRRPLLLEGEAGCGKSRLARAVAYELGLPFYPWYIRSTSKAQEGLYRYDAILRLHDVQTNKTSGPAPRSGPGSPLRDPSKPTDYREYGALGKAFVQHERPAVVLIDEIDKADLDFPNDLLTVLDDPWAFDIPETAEHITATHLPIVIITSNKEKGNLPAPFLRRCLYHFIEFPTDPVRLEQIVHLHYRVRQRPAPAAPLLRAAISRFLALRRGDTLHKKPGASELLDWLNALQSFGPSAPYPSAALADEAQPCPFPELLFKLRVDWPRAVAPGA